MKRIFKFRVWAHGHKPPCFINLSKMDIFVNNWQQFLDKFNDSLYTFQQWTGLLDKNGKEIYEGDILEQAKFKDKGEKLRFLELVMFENGAFVISSSLPDSETFHRNNLHLDEHMIKNVFLFEVVGNIFENPELMNIKS